MKMMRYKKSLELAQLRDAGERERYRLRPEFANSKDNGDNKKRTKNEGRKQKNERKNGKRRGSVK